MTMEGQMARAYSQDLRDRVIDAALLGGTPARHAAARFGIGVATAIRWVRQARESGDRHPGRQGQPRRSKLDAHRQYILELVTAAPDLTISEMLQRLAVERGVRAGRATLWTFLDRCGLRFKKSLRMRASRIARMS
jgi:transposase